jgi:hypothetical protein
MYVLKLYKRCTISKGHRKDEPAFLFQLRQQLLRLKKVLSTETGMGRNVMPHWFILHPCAPTICSSHHCVCFLFHLSLDPHKLADLLVARLVCTDFVTAYENLKSIWILCSSLHAFTFSCVFNSFKATKRRHENDQMPSKGLYTVGRRLGALIIVHRVYKWNSQNRKLSSACEEWNVLQHSRVF